MRQVLSPLGLVLAGLLSTPLALAKVGTSGHPMDATVKLSIEKSGKRNKLGLGALLSLMEAEESILFTQFGFMNSTKANALSLGLGYRYLPSLSASGR